MRHKAIPRDIETYEQFEEVIEWIASNCEFSVYMRGTVHSSTEYPGKLGWVRVDQCEERGLSMFGEPFAFGSTRDWMLFKMRWS